MKKIKTKEKLFQFAILLVIALIIVLGVAQLFDKAENLSLTQKAKAVEFFDTSYKESSVTVPRKEKAGKQYAYNEKVPVEVIKAEIRKQAKEFNLGENFMLSLAFCESGYSNMAKNPKSTAKGIYQFIASTWDNTVSGKKGLSPYDYKANIREGLLLYSLGRGRYEWRDCYAKLNLTD